MKNSLHNKRICFIAVAAVLLIVLVVCISVNKSKEKPEPEQQKQTEIKKQYEAYIKAMKYYTRTLMSPRCRKIAN